MRAFVYDRADDVAAGGRLGQPPTRGAYLAGGTTQLDLMLKDGVLAPDRLVDITRLPLRGITARRRALRVGALTTMEELAADPTSRERLTFVREALLAGASVQLRNMATIGGNLLQRTRCRYFRDPTVAACNKRAPGSGCAAVAGAARMHAVLGASEHCIALHASDLARPAGRPRRRRCTSRGPTGERRIPLTEFYVAAGRRPGRRERARARRADHRDRDPAAARRRASGYLKVRDRASYEFALTSAAVALAIEDGEISDARLALGGVGTVPWRAPRPRPCCVGARPGPSVFREAAEAAIADPFHRPRHRVQGSSSPSARSCARCEDGGDMTATVGPGSTASTARLRARATITPVFSGVSGVGWCWL